MLPIIVMHYQVMVFCTSLFRQMYPTHAKTKKVNKGFHLTKVKNISSSSPGAISIIGYGNKEKKHFIYLEQSGIHTLTTNHSSPLIIHTNLLSSFISSLFDLSISYQPSQHTAFKTPAPKMQTQVSKNHPDSLVGTILVLVLPDTESVLPRVKVTFNSLVEY